MDSIVRWSVVIDDPIMMSNACGSLHVWPTPLL